MSKSKFNVARECQNHLWEVGQNPRIKETNRRDSFFKLILMSGNRYMFQKSYYISVLSIQRKIYEMMENATF
jgi:hypothetical protein